MQAISMILGFLLILVSSPVRFLSVHAEDDPMPRASDMPYEVEPFHYKGTIAGYEVDVNGTIEEIYAKMEKTNPQFSAELYVNTVAAQSVAVGTVLETQAKDKTICCPVPGQKWQWAQVEALNIGIKHLKGITGGPCGVNARSCARVSCGYHAAIYLCNDNNHWIGPTCPNIATYAEDLIRDCKQNQLNNCGQKFDTDGFNVIVRHDSC